MLKNVKWFIGCSGFYYKEWKRNFYPDKLPQNKWFSYYCSQYNTLELNVTFYRFPQLSFLENWYNKSPEEFMFSVKAPRTITHYRQFQNCEQLLKEFYEVVKEGLKNKLGCILFQLPAGFEYSKEKLDRIIHVLDNNFDNVIEFRNIGWWNKKVYDGLANKRISFCGVSINNLPDKPILNSKVVYYRFHGVPQLYTSSYNEKEMKKVANAIAKDQTAKKAFIYFNNTAALSAIHNARWLQQYVK
ncbi:MAG TPA: DUF72 domain-containing protein [Puia sp.]|jgi:uncharacterized protein YecE (DUF72 family)|nr:DUF72 domain-containing protein [Puia sp.]